MGMGLPEWGIVGHGGQFGVKHAAAVVNGGGRGRDGL
jgi:hypothetical protein